MTAQLPPLLQTSLKDARLAMHFLDLQLRATALPFPAPGAPKAPAIPPERLRQLRDRLFANGINLREHCEQLGISYQAARDLLIGKANGRRGKAHDAAIALGLKPDPATLQLAA